MSEPLQAVLSEAAVDGGLPPRPDPDLDPWLDAVVACVARYGWSRTTARDIAREAGVERTTVYRHLGAKDDMFRVVVAREVHRLIDHALEVAATNRPGPAMVVELLAASVEYIQDNPAIAKILDDDPELLSGFLAEGIPAVIERFSTALGPGLTTLMQLGYIAERDATAVTQWLVRIGISLLVAPPPGELRAFLAEVLVPVLTPEPAKA